MVPKLFLTRDSFVEDDFSMDRARRDGFRTIQAHHIYCTLYFYFYHIHSSSDQQALESGGW